MNYKIVGKYIKDLNFSIPNTKAFYLLSKDIANYKINIDIRSNRVKQNIIEVFISLNLTPLKNNSDTINTKIVFATIVELLNEKIEKGHLEKIVLIEIPSQVYSELRNIFVGLFENSGFKDINISKELDFQSLYNRRKIQ